MNIMRHRARWGCYICHGTARASRRPVTCLSAVSTDYGGFYSCFSVIEVRERKMLAKVRYHSHRPRPNWTRRCGECTPPPTSHAASGFPARCCSTRAGKNRTAKMTHSKTQTQHCHVTSHFRFGEVHRGSYDLAARPQTPTPPHLLSNVLKPYPHACTAFPPTGPSSAS